ncbi:hypothetical protein IW261DRAFT_1387665 [Armillaria novae-zelandiae]|uniref:Protein kinase domain-containing protein n=1 Tax=Armillaria novae-zelandiae TaxID=153914 RepID=A0AA39UI53_9AGAR|nr:hypothetical protein IW261DRAFT_1387665 [Armillaria novae-zelandiae]
MTILIFIETPPLSYARMRTRLAKKREEQAGQSQQDNRSSSPDPVPTTPSSHSVASDDDDEQLGVSEDDDFEDELSPLHEASQPAQVPQTPQKAALKDKASAEVQSTPYSHGSASYSVAELLTQDGQIHNMDEADAYLKDDLRYRIFIEFETFLVNVLHLPDNWRVALESDIAAVQNDTKFRTSFTDYLRLCNEVGTGIEKERELYRPHAELCNHVIDVLQSQPTSEVPEGDQIRFHRVDPYVVRGSMAMLKPDIVGVMDKLLVSTPEGIAAHKWIKTIGDKSHPVVVAEPNPNGEKSKGSKDPRRHIPGWPQVLELKEMKGTDDTIDEGSDAIRLKTKDGKDPLTTRPKKNRTYLKDKLNVMDLPGPESAPKGKTSQAGSRSRKRGGGPRNKPSSSKRSLLSKTVSSKAKVGNGRQKVLDEEGFAPGTNNAEKARIQCARYALHILSNAGLRSHALVTLIDRDRIQLSYYDRSAIIVSQAIDLADPDHEIPFIAMQIGCHRLTRKQRGILDDIITDPYLTDFNRFNMISKDPELLFSGLEMNLKKGKKPIKLILGPLVYRQRGLFGRHTCVIRATCRKWAGKKLVVKISWPSASRKSEKELLDIAIAKAKEMAKPGETHWVLNHLPNILHEQDFKFEDDDSVHRMLAEMVHGGEYVGGRDGTYDERVLRITVSEELFPITSLRNDRHYAQVFVDILQCHKWLYEHPHILHRDISMANIMYRIDDEGNVLGVLIDFDLSSLVPIKEATSLRRTGTPPYMASDLLVEEKDSGPHLYRHDLEALFYVMLMICCRYSIINEVQPNGVSQLEEISAHFSEWFDHQMSWNILATVKTSFFIRAKPLPISPCFEGFRPCLIAIRRNFSRGMTARSDAKDQADAASWTVVPLPSNLNVDGRVLTPPPQIPLSKPFDDATLGGHIDYTQFLSVMWHFKERPLVVRLEDLTPATNPS